MDGYRVNQELRQVTSDARQESSEPACYPRLRFLKNAKRKLLRNPTKTSLTTSPNAPILANFTTIHSTTAPMSHSLKGISDIHLGTQRPASRYTHKTTAAIEIPAKTLAHFKSVQKSLAD